MQIAIQYHLIEFELKLLMIFIHHALSATNLL